VLAKDERHSSSLAKAAMGKADSVSFDELCRRGLMCVVTHKNSPFGFPILKVIFALS
jgi:hypothetical protein